MSPRNAPRKYDPLTAYLAGLDTDELTLTFAEIEQIIGAALPSSAWQSVFWVNSPKGTFTVRPWRRAGWRVAGVRLAGPSPTVTFVRLPPDSTPSLSARPR